VKLSNAVRRTSAALAVGAMSLGLVTVTGGAAQAAAQCTGDVSIYGTLSDGRLTYTQIAPNTGDRVKTLVGPALGFTPKAMATLNFNTILVTSTAGDLYRVDVQTNNTSLTLANAPVKIWDGGWTFDKLTYDGHGHLYGTVAGQLHQYVVSQDKPSGSAHIGQHVVIDTGFVLKTLAAAGDDRIIASTEGGQLYSYKIGGVGNWKRSTLKSGGWSAVDSLVSPGGGLYYGRTNSGMYWYHDADPTDGDGSDIAYHPNDPVDASGWTQTLLSAYGNNCAYVPPVPVATTGEKIAKFANAQVGKGFGDFNFYHPGAWCAEFGEYVWWNAGAKTGGLTAAAGSFYTYGQNNGTLRTSAPKVGDAVVYGYSGGGSANHVNLVVAVDGDYITTVGGNESNMVKRTTFNWKTNNNPVNAGDISGFISPVS